MRLLLLPLVLVGCAQAGPPGFANHTDASVQPRPDSGEVTHPPIDAFVSHIDAPPGQMVKTLDENTNDTLAAGTAIACPSSDPFGDTAAASYFRVFDLATFNITTDFHVSQVSFQVDDCETFSGNGTTVTAKVGTYVGAGGNALALADLQMLAQDTNVAVPEVVTGGAGATVNVPLTATIPAGGKLFVEIDSSDGYFDHSFYVGANTAGESAPSYIMAGDCSTTVPTAISTIYTTHAVDLLMTVTGSY